MRYFVPTGLFLAAALAVLVVSTDRPTIDGAQEGGGMQSTGGRIHAPEFPGYADWINTDRDWTMQDFRGKFVLLDFWTYCCINCMHVLPDLKRLEEKYPQLVVVGVHSAKFEDEGKTGNIREAILRYDIEHPVLNDYRFELWKAYGIRAWPSFALVDPEGYVIGSTSGEGIFSLFDQSIARLTPEYESRGVLNRERIEFNLEKFRAPRSLLAFPGKLEADPAKGRLFVSDSNNDRILIVRPDGAVLDVIGSGLSGSTDGSFEEARFLRPQGMALDSAADVLYVADTENHLIRRVDLKARTVSTILGTGSQGGRSSGGHGTALGINSPWDVLLHEGRLIIAMAGPHQLWSLDLADGRAEPWAGSGREDIQDGPALEAALAQPSGLSSDGRAVYFADSETSSIRKVAAGRVSTLVGEGLFEFGDVDGPLKKARFQHALGVLWHEDLVYVADTYNNKIRIIDSARGEVRTLVGNGESGNADGKRLDAGLNEPNDIVFLDGLFYITDTNNGLIRVYDPGSEEVSTLELKDLRKLALDSDSFSIKPAVLEERTIGPGEEVLNLTLDLGDGMKINTEAPNSVEITTSDRAVVEVGSVRLDTRDGLKVQAPLQASPGRAVLTVDLALYYCDKDNSGRCFLEQARYELPLRVEPGGRGSLTLMHRVPRTAD